jgi:hypothetical protein
MPFPQHPKSMLPYRGQDADSLRLGWFWFRKQVEGAQNFRSRQHRAQGPSPFPYSGDRVALPGVKQTGKSVTHPLISSAEFQNRVEQYLYCLSVSLWKVTGREFALTSVYVLAMWQCSLTVNIMVVFTLSQFWEFISNITSLFWFGLIFIKWMCWGYQQENQGGKELKRNI